MSDSRELLDAFDKATVSIAGMWYAQVCQPLPVTEIGDLYVIIPEIDPDTFWGPVFWQPRVTLVPTDVSESPESTNLVDVGQVQLPVIGSECLVIFDNRQNVWVVMWR